MFDEGLTALICKEGAHVVIEERSANAWMDRLQRVTDVLAARTPAVIVAVNSVAGPAVARAADGDR